MRNLCWQQRQLFGSPALSPGSWRQTVPEVLGAIMVPFHSWSLLQVGEFRAHAAEWTANVTAEFKETRRRLSVEIYDKFQRATSIKRKLSAELAVNHNQDLTPCKRTLSVNHLTSEKDLLPALTKTDSIYMNGLTPHCAAEEIAVIENIK